MTELNYTKGEWEAILPKEGNGYWKIICEGVEIGVLYNAVTDEKLEANAHLIAASPDMYEALSGLLIFLIENGYTDDNLVAVINKGTRAIAKAGVK